MNSPLPIVQLPATFCPTCKHLSPNCGMGQNYHKAKWFKVLCKCVEVQENRQLELFEVPA